MPNSSATTPVFYSHPNKSNGELWAEPGGVMSLRLILRLGETIVMSPGGPMAIVSDEVLKNHSPCCKRRRGA